MTTSRGGKTIEKWGFPTIQQKGTPSLKPKASLPLKIVGWKDDPFPFEGAIKAYFQEFLLFVAGMVCTDVRICIYIYICLYSSIQRLMNHTCINTIELGTSEKSSTKICCVVLGSPGKLV